MAERTSHAALAAALTDALTRTLQAALPAVLVAPRAAVVAGTGWRLSAEAGGGADGEATVWIDHSGAAALVARLVSADTHPTDAVIEARLRVLWAEVLEALAGDPSGRGLALQPLAVQPGEPPADGAFLDLTAGEAAATIAVAAALRPAEAADEAAEPGGSPLETLLDIDLPLVVRFARTVMSIKTLASVGPGTVVDMERSPDEPVELLVGNRVIAHGEVVVVGGNYGVRVTRLCGPQDRMRALEA